MSGLDAPNAAVFAILMLAFAFAVIRLIRGPSLADRVVALDVVATATVGMIAAYAVTEDEPVLLDAAIVAALITFLGTVAFAKYLERRERDE